MNTVDIVLGILLLLGLIQGFRKGLFVELASLIGLLAGIYGAIHFSYYAANYLAEKTEWNEQTINLASFAITFLIIVIVISMAGKLLTKIADFAMLGIVNKILGAAFGVLKTAFILSVILMFWGAANRNLGFVDEGTIEESALFSPVQSLAPMFLPTILKEAEENDIYDSRPEEEQSI